ncbi:MAG: hypothetical protein ACM3UN_03365 [Bacillota bacterium]
MVSEETKKTLPTFSQNTVFEVCSKCSCCGSTLRIYNKLTKKTTCNQCGKKQPKPKLDLDKLKYYDDAPDLSFIEESCHCKNPSGWFSTNKDGREIVFCQRCGKEII